MDEIKIRLGEVALCVYKDSGRIKIEVDAANDLKRAKVDIIAKNAGLLGIIGPDLEFNLGELCSKECEEARSEALSIQHDDPQKSAKRLIPLLINRSLREAISAIGLSGFVARVVEQEGSPREIFSDLNNKRINLRIAGGKVISAYVG